MPLIEDFQAFQANQAKGQAEFDIERDQESFKQGLETYIARRITHSMFSNDPEIKLLKADGKIDAKSTTNLLKKLEELDFYTHLKTLSLEASLTGICGFLITGYDAQTKLVAITSRFMFLPIWDQYGDMIAIKLTRKIFAGAKPYFTQQTISKDRIITLFSVKERDGYASFAEFNKQTQDFQTPEIPEVQEINMSKVPVAIISNKPFSPNVHTETPELFFQSLTSTYDARELMPRLLHIWKMLGLEIHRGRTILLSEDGSPDISGETQRKIESYNNYDMVNLIDGNDIQYVGGSFTGVEALRKEFKEVLNEYLKRCFVSTTSSNAGKNQKNDMEIYAGSREEIQYIESRCAIMQKQIKYALELFIEAYNKNPYNKDNPFGKDLTVVVNIITNEVRDSMVMADTYQNLYVNGILPQELVIKKILSVGDLDAKAIMEKQLKEEEAKMKREQKLNPPQVNTEKPAKPAKPAKPKKGE